MGSPPQFQSFNSISSVMFLDCTIAIGCFNSDHDHDEWEGLQWQPITALLWLLIWLLLPIPKSAKGYFCCLPQSVSCRVPVSIWLFPVILIHFLRNDKEFWAFYMQCWASFQSEAHHCSCCHTQAGVWCGYTVSSSKNNLWGILMIHFLSDVFSWKVKNDYKLRDMLQYVLFVA